MSHIYIIKATKPPLYVKQGCVKEAGDLYQNIIKPTTNWLSANGIAVVVLDKKIDCISQVKQSVIFQAGSW